MTAVKPYNLTTTKEPITVYICEKSKPITIVISRT